MRSESWVSNRVLLYRLGVPQVRGPQGQVLVLGVEVPILGPGKQ